MDQIRVLYRLAITVVCFGCLGFSVGICSKSDALIKTYVSSSLHSDGLLSSTKLQIPEVTKSDWDSLVMESKVPVMVLFTTSWCPQCHLMSSTMDSLGWEFAGRFKFYSVAIFEEPELAERWDVKYYPTTIVFKLGKVMDTRVAYLNDETLRELVEKYI